MPTSNAAQDSARTTKMVAKYRSGLAIAAIATHFELSRQRVGQLIGEAATDEDRAARAEAIKKARDKAKAAAEKAELAKKKKRAKRCKVCRTRVMRGKKLATCSPECSQVWRKARSALDPKAAARQRMSVARYIMKDPERWNDAQVRWAKKVVSGKAGKARVARTRNGSERNELIASRRKHNGK